jgi:2-aminoethylphosphonate-pyruvate transaminase
MTDRAIPGWKDKTLFTPGPLTTSRTIKQAMLRDLGARDGGFLRVVAENRRMLLKAAELDPEEYDVIFLQGSGTYGVEAVLGAVPRDGRVLVVNNGAYGARMARICAVAGINHTVLAYPENLPANPADIEIALMDEPAITHVAVVHLETTSGLVNPIDEIGAIAARHEKQYFVDAMCSFGAVPVDFAKARIDWLVSSANKCLEGVPGFTFVIARLDCLRGSKGNARSLSLDLHDQWEYYGRVGQFRFTPPVQSLLAFHQAMVELEAEGGVAGRAARYRGNFETLLAGMRAMGFAEYVPAEHQGYIITTFMCPDDPSFDFNVFYDRLSLRGYDIYSGKVAEGNCFRIGNIGRIFQEDMEDLLAAIRDTLRAMGVGTLNL